LRRAANFLDRNFLPAGLLAAMALAFVVQGPGLYMAEVKLQRFTTAGIFIISGLSIKGGEAARATKAVGAVAFGLVSILLLTPLAGLLVMRCPLEPASLVLGLAVFLCMPTTLSSGVALTTLAGGNTALALLLTVTSNFLGIFTIPVMLSVVLGAGLGIDIPTWPMLRALVKTVLAPTLLGVALRRAHPAVAAFCDRRKKWLSNLSTCFLVTVPYAQLCTVLQRDVAVGAAPIAAVTALALAVHVVYLAANTGACRALGVGGSEPAGGPTERAVVLVTSQKTLPISVAVLEQLGPVLGPAGGLAVVPCIAAHLGQIFVDAFLVGRWTAAAEEGGGAAAAAAA